MDCRRNTRDFTFKIYRKKFMYGGGGEEEKKGAKPKVSIVPMRMPPVTRSYVTWRT